MNKTNKTNSGSPEQPLTGPSSNEPYVLDQYTSPPSSGQQDDSPFFKSQAPSIMLPKGGGALKGIDEKFSVNAVNGTAGLEIPLPITPGRGGFTPALSLSYNSGSGNSEFGLGWSLSLPAIQRRTDKQLPRYDDANESDVFLLAGAEDLVPELDSNGNRIIITSDAYTIKRYRPRIEGSFARMEHIRGTGIPGSWWRVTTQDNITTYYGLTEFGRIANPENGDQVYKWLPELVVDHKGNVQRYEYKVEDKLGVTKGVHEKNRLNGLAAFANTYLKKVQYCNEVPYFIEEADACYPFFPDAVNYLMDVVLDYGDHLTPYDPAPGGTWVSRTDAFSVYQSGFEIRTYRLCRRVLMFHHFPELNGKALVRSLELSYKQDAKPAGALTEADFITGATQKGHSYTDGNWREKALPFMSFDYEALNWNTEIETVSEQDLAGAPQGLATPYQWIDFEGEGISGILTEQANGWFYKSNLGDGQFAPPKSIAPKPSFTGLADGGLQWQDLDADGRRQVVSETPVKGFWELDDDQKWHPFRHFKKNLNIDWNSPLTKMLDLNGDGKADVLLTEERVWTWYENQGTVGFDQGGTYPAYQDEEKGPLLLLRDNVQSVFLANMSGSGMTDLVRIKNGEICYWPNKGYGKFGAKVTMSNAPVFRHPDLYNPQYLTLADISGTGAADLIYIGQNKCTAWINLSGNGWSEATDIHPLPATNSFSKIAVLDFLGNGTGCIVWSSSLPQHARSPLQYVDLMDGKKPYLMKSYSNGMGKTVNVTYKSSTQFYLTDKLAGDPWVTRLPFPVHCIHTVTTSDSVSETTYTQTYRYRHGYYDHEEREFRGFGYVETLDTDSAILSDVAELDQAPVLTKTWYHTGAWIRKGTLLEQFKKEYFRFDGWDTVTKIADFPTGMNAQEQREAYRALKGLALRQEVYALDESGSQHIPYTVTASAYTVKRVQRQMQNRFASFFTHPQQSIVFNCERNAADPRILHDLTLETDEYGNVLRSARVVYPRQDVPAVSASYPQKVKDEQERMHIVYTQNGFTEDVIDVAPTSHHYRLRLPCEAKTFELLGVDVPAGLWTIGDLLAVIGTAVPIDFSATPTGSEEIRLLGHTRTLYKDNDASSTPLTLGALESLAIPHEQYQLAFTDDLRTHCYGVHVTDAMLDDGNPSSNADGGYVDLDGNDYYWLPSGTAVYDASPTLQFYTPVAFSDPWGNQIAVSYWGSYWLLPEEVTDAKGNVSTVLDYDWRCLQPTRMKDINDNYADILYDALCMPVALALKGKGNITTAADELGTLDPDGAIDRADQALFWSNPQLLAPDLLQNATWRCIYDLDTSGNEPVRVAMIAREQHYADLDPGEVSDTIIRISYTDGFGRVAMHKQQCAPVTISSVSHSWIGSGKTVYNNKGKTVLQYEPYFSTTHDHDPSQQAAVKGVSPQLYYDPLGRLYKTIMPDKSYSETERTAWMQMQYDANDTAGYWGVDDFGVPVFYSTSDWYDDNITGSSEEQDAAQKTQQHADTPTVIHLDTLARPFYTVQYLTDMYIASVPGTDFYESYTELDMLGNRLSVVDARGNTPLSYRYNLLKQPCRTDSIDSGTQLMLTDVAGQPLYSWDADDREFYISYDVLRRPLEKTVDGVLFETMDYGEGQTNDKLRNLRGQLYRQQNGGGEQTVIAYDFKGNPLETEQKLLYNATTQDVDLDTATFTELFTSLFTYDALSRPVQQTDPGGNVTEYVHDAGGLLYGVTLNTAPYVRSITYDAKGQRQSILYGNYTKTKYTYDPLTFRLTRLCTRNINATSTTYNETLQDLYYYYDPVGNITTIRDDTQQTIFYANTIITPTREFTYDALYRLTEAQGREQIGTTAFGADDNFNDAAWMATLGSDAAQSYTQTYLYDEVGNITNLQHSAGTGSYTRTYYYDAASNRLLQTRAGTYGSPYYNYTHDTRGNMIVMPHLSAMDWNTQNQLSHITQGTTDAYYQYSNGQRIRKWVEKTGGITEERIYLGSYERYRRYISGVIDVERSTVHISDDTGRIAMLEVLNPDYNSDGAAALLTRYSYSNHLQSASLELDENAEIISHEEYHPYGTTAYQAKSATINAVAKRYRYTGKERDEESGLYYHGARYYVPWLARWSAVDPFESDYAGWSSYNYGVCNPVKWMDSTGMKPEQENGYLATMKISGPGSWRDDNGDIQSGIIGGDLNEVTITGRNDSRWLDINGSKIDRYQYSEEGFSDPMNYVRFFDNMGFSTWNGAVDLTNAVINSENTLRATVDYLSNALDYWLTTSLTQQWNDTEEQVVNAATDIQTYENIGAALILKNLKVSKNAANTEFANKQLFSNGMGIEPASENLLTKVSERRNLVIAKKGSDELNMLDYFKAEASVNGENYTHIILRENPSKIATLEEFLHGTQSRLGIIDQFGFNFAEFHVKDFMIRHANFLGLQKADIDMLKIQREQYYQLWLNEKQYE